MRVITISHSGLAIVAALLTCVAVIGCNDPEYETIRGLQEENKVLRDQLSKLEAEAEQNDKKSSSQIDQLKAEAEQNEKEVSNKIEQLKKLNAEILAAKEEVQREKLANMESELSSMRLRLGAKERENLTFKEIVDGEPRIKSAIEEQSRVDILVFALLLGIALTMNGFFIWKYKSATDRLNLLIMKQAGELRRIGGDV